jgi:hypothetical protein
MLKSSPGLKEAFDSYGIDDTNRLFIKEMIAGPLESHDKRRYSTAVSYFAAAVCSSLPHF